MAVKVMHWVWEHAADVQGNDLLVLLALADWANDDGICWPSVPRLALKARVSVRTAQYTIRRLVARGYVTLEPGGGRRHPNRYTVQMPHPSAPQTPQSPHVRSPSRGATAHANGAAAAPNPAPAAAPEPSSEPSHEPSGRVALPATPRRVAPSPAVPAPPTPAEAVWHTLNQALDRWTPGIDPPFLPPDVHAVATALGGLPALAALRPHWPAVLGAYNRLVCDRADGAGTAPGCDRRDDAPPGGTPP